MFGSFLLGVLGVLLSFVGVVLIVLLVDWIVGLLYKVRAEREEG